VAIENPASALSRLKAASDRLADARTPAEALAAALALDPAVTGAALASMQEAGVRHAVETGPEEALAMVLVEAPFGSAVWSGIPLLLSPLPPAYELLAGPEARSAAVLPLRAGARSLGALALVFSDERAFDDAEQLVLHALAGEFALWLEGEQLQLSEQRFLQMVEHAPEGIVVLDVDAARFVTANPQAERMFGMTRDELLSVGPVEISPAVQPDGRPSSVMAIEKIGLALEGETPAFEWTHQRKDGTPFLCEVRLLRVPSSDARLVRGSLLDVTERRRAEDAERRLELERAQSDALRRARDQLAAVQTIIDENPTSADEMLEAVLHAITGALETDYAVVLVADEDRRTLRARASTGLEREITESIDVAFGRGFAGTIAATRRPWVVDRVADIEVVSPYLRERARSIVGVPLLADGKLVGVLHTGTSTARHFDQSELTVLRLAAERIAPAMQRTVAYELQHHIASQLQQTLLPRSLPKIAGVELAALFRAGGDGVDVGGDFYDIFPTGESQWVIQLGDVCGHGPSAAAASALVRAAVRTLAHSSPAPAQLLEGANRVLRLADEYDVFCTMLVAWLDASPPDGPRLSVARAGHPPLLVARNGGDVLEAVEPGGPVLGVVEDPSYEEATVTLRPGDAALLYTDGLFERTPGISDEEGLRDLVARWRDLSAAEMIVRLEEALGDAPNRDDIAAMAVRVTGA
jgi:PAS domain S-box-containing protein